MATSDEIKRVVVDAYKERNPRWGDVQVRSIIPHVLGGNLALAKFSDGKWDYEQLCFVDSDLRLSTTIFGSEEELARFIEMRGRQRPLLERFFDPQIIAGMIFLIFAVALIVGLFREEVNAAVLSVIGGIVGSAGTYYYTKKAAKG